MTTPVVVTTLPVWAPASVEPWISLIARAAAGTGGVVAVGVGVGVAVGSTGVAAVSPAAFVGVGAATMKSAELTSVSRPVARVSAVVTDAADATVVSNVSDVP